MSTGRGQSRLQAQNVLEAYQSATGGASTSQVNHRRSHGSDFYYQFRLHTPLQYGRGPHQFLL